MIWETGGAVDGNRVAGGTGKQINECAQWLQNYDSLLGNKTENHRKGNKWERLEP